MRDFENIIALPHELDRAHRRAIVSSMANRGISLASKKWEDIHSWLDIHKTTYEGVIHTEGWNSAGVDYGGTIVFESPFGEHELRHQLVYSGLSYEYVKYRQSSPMGIFDRKIETDSIGPKNDRTIIAMPRDTPPFVMRKQDYDYISTAYFNAPREYDPGEAEAAQVIQEIFGDEAVVYLSNKAACYIIHALRHDTARPADG